MRQHELAAKLFQTPGNITRILDKLQEESLIERLDEAEDRRCFRIALTREGEARIGKVFPEFAAAMHELFKGSRPKNRSSLMSSCEKPARALRIH